MEKSQVENIIGHRYQIIARKPSVGNAYAAGNKNDTHLIDGLPPKGFSIPEAYQLQQLGIHARNDEDGTSVLKLLRVARRILPRLTLCPYTSRYMNQ